ncbi:MAG TPA: DegT/DnrJ/EryC1/StrS family aminotransferase, partial [Actinomycetota bacterium]|nr:DegT/DnrJ/EryC1/StrS family aminotransferase [Actinomycetota bacterium]
MALFKLGRHCLWHGLRSIGLDAGGVLVPAYHHGSEIEVLRVAGLDLRFYDVTDSLEPNVDELTDSDLDGVRALYLIHYLGFPQNAGKWRRWCDDRGLLLIEDVAQGWLGNSDGRPLGAYGDVSIFCLYKQLGVPDGGALATTGDVSSVATRSLGVGRLFRRHAAWASSRSAALARLTPPHVDRPKEAIADAEFRLGDPWTPPSGATNYLLPRLCHPAVAEMRRDNYRYLADRLGDLIAPGFDGLPEGASPFAFPIAVGAKD